MNSSLVSNLCAKLIPSTATGDGISSQPHNPLQPNLTEIFG